MALAMIMLSRANLLLLDEPTNHLDVESIEALEDALESYEGTVILVSHDRALLRALTTRVWSLRNLRITDYDDGFEEWEEVSAEREREAAAAASAEESARRERERKKAEQAAVKDGGSTGRDEERAARRAAREMEAVEAEIARLEGRAAELGAALEDPSLYESVDGTRRATELGAELEKAKRELDAALARWEELGVRAG
jgi:ATP-binding cassette subfamily F protein 3